MLNLLKYEFRKALTAMLILLGGTLAAEAYFLYGMRVMEEKPEHLAISMLVLLLLSLVVYIFVLVRGVASYSGELKSRSSYLIFMTPNSTRKIMASKFLFTLILCIIFGGLYALIGFVDFRMLLEAVGEYEEFIEALNDMLMAMGVHTDQLIVGIVFTVILVGLSMLSFFAVAYLAITLSHTLFRDKKWRWVMALIFYFVINYALNTISTLFPMMYTSLQIYTGPAVMYTAEGEMVIPEPDYAELFRTMFTFLLPQAVISLLTIVGSLFGCAWMLEKKVSL